MKKIVITAFVLFGLALTIPSCKDFLNPDQELNITEDKLFDDWYEFRSAEMGLYALQQQLVEQLMVLGELRGDLLTITPNAEPDLVEVYNFNLSKENKYASPTNFYRLISACNSFIRVLKAKHPEITKPAAQISNYDRLYGEALCMRSWAYFNAVRIYGKVPFIPESLTSMEEIEAYVNSPGIYIDSLYIEFSPDGYNNDTLPEPKPIELEKKYYDLQLVVDYCTNQLEKEVKAVGVNHYVDNNDQTWENTIWNTYAYHALLGQMYLTQGNYLGAQQHFETIVKNSSTNNQYQLDISFAYWNWRNIFTSIDSREHILTIWFNKGFFQQNRFQELFEPFGPHKFMLKPTALAIQKWESEFIGARFFYNTTYPERSRTLDPGEPGDKVRGYGSSFLYIGSNDYLSQPDWIKMMQLKRDGDTKNAANIMEGYDTIVYKYSINKDVFDQDAYYILYRAASMHLYLAEIYTYFIHELDNGTYNLTVKKAEHFMNDGGYDVESSNRPQMGVRGRAALPPFFIEDTRYFFDAATNKITGYKDLLGNLPEKQKWLEDVIMDERAKELAFEGERFYDLMRVALRRNDPSFLASRVSAKYPEGKRQEMYNYLLNVDNWYVKYFDDKQGK